MKITDVLTLSAGRSGPGRVRLIAAALLVLVLISCRAEQLDLEGRSFPDLLQTTRIDVKEDGSIDGLVFAAERHLAVLNRILSSSGLSVADRRYYETIRWMTEDILEAAGNPGFNLFLRQNFDFFRAGKPESVLVTGYYTPILYGSREQSERFNFPVYGKPEDLVTVHLSDFSREGILRGRIEGRRLVPYFTRTEIESWDAKVRKPILFVDDKMALFFLHVQGSGVVVFEDGSRARLNYAAGNGHSYKSLGKALIREGMIPQADMSMEAIYEYFKAHPEETDKYLQINPSFVFFETAKDGPFGSTGAIVTAGRTIAADARVFPKMGIAYLQADIPAGRNSDGSVRLESYKALVFHQDAGGAINGVEHIDLYFGEGDQAGFLAGHMKGKGSLYYLRPK